MNRENVKYKKQEYIVTHPKGKKNKSKLEKAPPYLLNREKIEEQEKKKRDRLQAKMEKI